LDKLSDERLGEPSAALQAPVELESGVVGGLFRGRAVIVGMVRDRAPRSFSPVLGGQMTKRSPRDIHPRRLPL